MSLKLSACACNPRDVHSLNLKRISKWLIVCRGVKHKRSVEARGFGDAWGMIYVDVSKRLKRDESEQHAWGIHAWGIPHKANSTRQVLTLSRRSEWAMASVSLADSEASFRRQASHVGLDEEWINGLVDIGVNTLGRLAFTVGQPGQPVEDQAVKDLLTSTHAARVITVGDIAVVKRLIFEAQTTVIAIIKSQSDPNNDPSLRKLPAAERNSRLEAQRQRLQGMSLEGFLEVAHQVYDVVSGMLEADSLKYLGPAKCITRSMEISSQKPPKELKLDASGTGIVVKEAQTEKECSVQGELDFMEALTRRSLAFDAVGLVKFEVFNQWINWMFQMVRQQPPPGFSKPTLAQLLRADRQAFVRLQDQSREGIKPHADGTRPLDDLIKNLTNDHTVTLIPSNENKQSWNKQQQWENDKWGKRQVWKPNKYQSSGSGSKGYGKNGGKLPQALKGCASTTPSGERICFAFNINGCDKCKPGETCDRGKHVCAVKNCHGNHSKADCSKGSSWDPTPEEALCMPKNSKPLDKSSQPHDTHHEYQPPSPARDEPGATESQSADPLSSSSKPAQVEHSFVDEGAFGIEFCSGTGGLTAQLRVFGLPASFGVDHKVKAGAKAPICKLDLTDDKSVELALSWVAHPNCKYVHLGVPCGTCSRAREIVLDEFSPLPLRDEDHPDGLPNLSEKDQARVDLANAVYAAAVRIILCADANNKLWSLEQPSRSLFWNTSFWKCIMAQVRDAPYYASFHSCMFGGQRPKSTTFAANFKEILELTAECDRQHPHLAWGRTAHGFATAQEVEYPLQLCKELAMIIQRLIPAEGQPRVHTANPDKKARAITFKHTKKSLAFMPEYATVVTASFNSKPPFKAGDKIKTNSTCHSQKFQGG